jgi:hypothetical protein
VLFILTKRRYALYSKYVGKYNGIVLVAFCAILLYGFSACGLTRGGTATQTLTTAITPGPQSVSLINGDISVNAETNYAIPFIIDANMKEVTIEGKFKTVDGRPNIEVYLMDDATYTVWITGHNVSTILYDSQKVSIGFINQSITVPGKYQLVFTNWSKATYSPSQQVSATVDLKWIY